MLVDDLINRFPNLDTTIIYKYFPLYEDTYSCYYNAIYGSNKCDDEIILTLLAHLIQVADSYSNGLAIQQVASESVGSVSTSYVATPLDNNDKFFTSTIYGQTYLMLIKKNMGMYFV